VDLTQQGSNLVATGSGPIDLTGLTQIISALPLDPFLDPSGLIITGAAAGGTVFPIPTILSSFGSGSGVSADSATGDLVGISAFSFPGLVVPDGYHSDGPLSDTATYDNQTFKSFGLTPGTTFETAWGNGANQNFTLVIGASTVPEPSTWAMLLGFAGLGLAGWRHRRITCNA
jgi:PEP-CTERM motif